MGEEDVIAPGFLAGLGATFWIEKGCTRAHVDVLPAYCKPGTNRVRVGVVATVVDVVAGAPAHAILSPTVDLRVCLLGTLPASGDLEFVCRPARVGRQLFVGEVDVYSDDPSKPHATAVCTYVNRPIEGANHQNLLGEGSSDAKYFDDMLPMREVTPEVYELDNSPDIGNSRYGTIQGGVQSLFVELAAEQALLKRREAEYEVVDLDVRYLNGLRTPTARALVEICPGSIGDPLLRVAIVEADADQRVVSLATVRCRAINERGRTQS